MVIPGSEVLAQQNFKLLHGKAVGLMTNPGAVTRTLRSTYDLFAASDEVHLSGLYGPEHGFSASVQDGQKVESSVDARTGVPIHSLYGATMRPTPEMLADIDVMVCDIQDTGVRYYTFLWTISHIIEVCGELNIPVILLDRPNPIGDTVSGFGLDSDISTLVGRYDIPIQHGMTLAEMTAYLNQNHNENPCDLTVIPCENYQRGMSWEATGLHFVPPSPNMPHLVTARHYAGSCLIEGTGLSEGRGTTLPFEIVGAPYIDGDALAQELNALDLSGVRFRPHAFQPNMSKYAGESCSGVQAHISDLSEFRPIETWLHVISTIRRNYPDQFEWKEKHFDRLIGNVRVRQAIDAGERVAEMMAGCDDYCADFQQKRKPYLLYD